MNTQQKYAQSERKSKNHAQLALPLAKPDETAGLPSVQVRPTKSGELVITSIELAAGLEIQHKNILETIKKYAASIKEFGHLTFETETVKNSVGAVNEKHYALLNENQALFVGSLSRNTERVVQFKVTLVKEFDRVRCELQEKSQKAERCKTILKLEKQIRQMTIEQSRLNEIVKAKVDNPVIPPAHELKAKILGNIKALADASYASTFVSIMNNFIYDMEHHYCVNIGKATRYVGEGPLDVYIRLGYSAQLEELADFKYSPVKK